MKSLTRSILFSATGLLSGLLVSCAGNMDTAALVPTNAKASHRSGQSVTATVTGGSARDYMLANISNEDFKQALESGLVKSGLFKSAGSGGYQLNASITSVEQPFAGISMRVNMNVNYTLNRGSAVVWRKSIRSTYNAPLGEAFVGAVRVRKATEGAARENIALLVHSLDEKQL